MKIEYENEKIIIYLYRYMLDINDVENLNKEIKNLFIKLIKVYKIDFFGYSKVHIYHNEKYGNVLEIEKIYKPDFDIDIIDLKLVIHENVPFYLEIDDYLFNDEIGKMYYINNKVYVDIDSLDNLLKYLEFGKIVYKSELLHL